MIKTIAVLGAGTMGHGIAHAAMAAGYDTRLYDPSRAQLDIAEALITGIVRKGVDLGKVTAAEGEATCCRLRNTTSVEKAVRGVDLVIEAAPEKVDLKIALLSEVETYAAAESVSTFAEFQNVAAGVHTVQIYVRGSATSCEINFGNFNNQVVVEEYQASTQSVFSVSNTGTAATFGL